MYSIMAVVATVVNIVSQALFLGFVGGRFSIPMSVFFGTVVGLAVKYILDKRFIFDFKARDAAHDGRTFGLYTAMGVVTTVIFWGFELGFHQIFKSDGMRYMGGILGLAIGYVVKYQLDKRFVFAKD